MAKKKTKAIDYSHPENLIELYLAKAIGENVTLPATDDERILVYLRKLIEVIEQSGGGTEVIANPTLAGTEAALTGLQVGDTKYKVNEIPHLYLYTVGLYDTTNHSYNLYVNIYTTSDTMDKDIFFNYFVYDPAYTNRIYDCVGWVTQNDIRYPIVEARITTTEVLCRYIVDGALATITVTKQNSGISYNRKQIF